MKKHKILAIDSLDTHPSSALPQVESIRTNPVTSNVPTSVTIKSNLYSTTTALFAIPETVRAGAILCASHVMYTSLFESAKENGSQAEESGMRQSVSKFQIFSTAKAPIVIVT